MDFRNQNMDQMKLRLKEQEKKAYEIDYNLYVLPVVELILESRQMFSYGM